LLDIKNVGELGRSGCLISATPFMQYVPGSEMAKDKNLICTSKRVSINGKTLRKKEEILPDDDRTREAALKFLRNYRLQEAGFKNEIKHLPSTIRSLLNYRYVSKLFKKTEPVLDDLIEGYVKKMRN